MILFQRADVKEDADAGEWIPLSEALISSSMDSGRFFGFFQATPGKFGTLVNIGIICIGVQCMEESHDRLGSGRLRRPRGRRGRRRT